MPGAMNFNKRFANDGGSATTFRRVATTREAAPPLTATSVLRDADARERTIAIHGIVAASVDALVEEMRTCGHIVRSIRSRRCSSTLFVTFGSALAAKAAAELQGNAIVDGQRFAVTLGALPEDEAEDDDVQVPPPSTSSSLSAVPQRLGGAVVQPSSVGASKSVSLLNTPAVTTGGPSQKSGFQKVKFSFLSCLPLADRWLLPLLVSRDKEVQAPPKKRGREE